MPFLFSIILTKSTTLFSWKLTTVCLHQTVCEHITHVQSRHIEPVIDFDERRQEDGGWCNDSKAYQQLSSTRQFRMMEGAPCSQTWTFPFTLLLRISVHHSSFKIVSLLVFLNLLFFSPVKKNKQISYFLKNEDPESNWTSLWEAAFVFLCCNHRCERWRAADGKGGIKWGREKDVQAVDSLKVHLTCAWN